MYIKVEKIAHFLPPGTPNRADKFSFVSVVIDLHVIGC